MNQQRRRDPYPTSPGSAIMHIRLVTGRSGSQGKWKWFRSFDWFSWYCVTPPVYPTHVYKPVLAAMRPGRPVPETVRPQMCIACRKVHITSEDCGREPSEANLRDSTVRRDDGYKLIQARNMGALDD